MKIFKKKERYQVPEGLKEEVEGMVNNAIVELISDHIERQKLRIEDIADTYARRLEFRIDRELEHMVEQRINAFLDTEVDRRVRDKLYDIMRKVGVEVA